MENVQSCLSASRHNILHKILTDTCRRDKIRITADVAYAAIL